MHLLLLSKKHLFVAFAIQFLTFSTIAQVGIGNVNPNSDALLEIGTATSTAGLLIPRVTLTTGTTSPAPLSNNVAGMLIYNTATVGDVTPGFYYNDGALWIRLANNDDWKTTGNAGTTTGTNFIGTTDNISFIVKTNNSERMRVLNNGQVTINETTPFVGDRFTVTGATDEYVINAYATGTNGIGIYATSDGSSGRGVYGTNSSSGRGIYGTNNSSGQGVRGWSSGTGFGIFGSSTSATAEALGAKNYSTGSAIIAAGNNGSLYNLTGSGGTFNGTTGIIGLTTSLSGTGISGVGNTSTTSRTLTDGSGVAGSGDTGVYGISTAASNGTGIIGVGGLTSAITTNNSGSGIAGSGLSTGVFGYAGNGDDVSANYGNAGAEFVLDGDNDPTTNTTDVESNRARAILAGFNNVAANDDIGGSYPASDSYFGGYFSGGNENGGSQTYSYSALRYNTGTDGTSGGSTTDFKVIGPGSNSTIIKDKKGTPRILFSPEAPEILFQDFGVGQLVNGTARINIDPILKESIFIDNKHPLKVYVTLEGDCKGVYVTGKSADGFTVKEIQGGTSNISFSWQIVANRADTKDRNGKTVSKHVGVRLPIGPGPLTSELKKVKSHTEEAKEEKIETQDYEKIIKSSEDKNSQLKSLIPVKKN